MHKNELCILSTCQKTRKWESKSKMFGLMYLAQRKFLNFYFFLALCAILQVFKIANYQLFWQNVEFMIFVNNLQGDLWVSQDFSNNKIQICRKNVPLRADKDERKDWLLKFYCTSIFGVWMDIDCVCHHTQLQKNSKKKVATRKTLAHSGLLKLRTEILI